MSGVLLYAISIGVCAGVGLSLLSNFGMLIPSVCLAGAVVFLFAGKSHKKFLMPTVVLAALSLGGVRAELFLNTERAETVSQFFGKTVVVEGRVTADPDQRAASVRVRTAVSSVNNAPAAGNMIAVLPRETVVSYGDTVMLRGAVVAPQTFVTDSGRVFDYPAYLRAQGISALMEKGELVRRESGGVSVRGALFSLKHSFEFSLERLLPEPRSSLLEGVLLGERRSVPQSLTDAFIVSGLIHVVVLSGYNISIVAESVLRFFSFLPRTIGFSLGGVSIIFFALMTGGGATTIRACIMAVVAILARYLHRSAIALRALAVAAAGMVLWNPLVLLYDPSFILSVLATFGLVTLSPWVEARLPLFFSRFPSVRSITASTIAVQLFVLPALLYFTGVLSFLALPANVLALPVVPLAMLSGFFAGVLGWLHPLLAFVPAQFADLLLRWMIAVAETASSVPFSSATIAAFPAWVAAIAYVPLTRWAISVYRRTAAPSHSSSGS